jgi:glycosyltransferase involved in cell wall biosynthesis
MKIVLFYHFLTTAGGAERVLLEEERHFRRMGADVTIIVYSLKSAALFDYCPAKLEVLSQISRVSRIFALSQKLRDLKPDLVIAQSHGGARYLSLATMFTSIPYITHIHGSMFWFPEDLLKYGLIHRGVFSEIRKSVVGHMEFIPRQMKMSIMKRLAVEFRSVLDYFAVRKSRAIIVLTDQVKWEVAKLYKKEAIVIRGCLRPEILHYGPRKDLRSQWGLNGKTILLSIGRLDARKRVDVLIRAFSFLSNTHPELHLVIAGKGEDESRLKDLVISLDLGPKVSFIGFVKEEELWDSYAACDVFVFPSWTTSGITTYEALALGKKVVWSSEAQEPVEILNNPLVFLSDPTVEGLVRGIAEALDSDGGEIIDLRPYTWDNYVEKVWHVAFDIVGTNV